MTRGFDDLTVSFIKHIYVTKTKLKKLNDYNIKHVREGLKKKLWKIYIFFIFYSPNSLKINFRH